VFLDILLLAAALAALLLGARYFVDGVSAFAAQAGVPPLVIGMTLVAFGTSLPELVINSLSAARGSTGLAFGNIAGSCLLNIGFVLALTAVLHPLRVETSLLTREIPMLVVSVSAALVLSGDAWLDGAAGSQWERTDGLALLLFFSIFVYYTARGVLAAREDRFVEEVRAEEHAQQRRAGWRQAAFALGGLVGIWLGADGAVDRAVSIARTLGVSEALIGLTLLSFGTTLPELATCLIAVRRGNPEMALGNVVGSNI
jgi:Ca2+/Na+ antiporter